MKISTFSTFKKEYFLWKLFGDIRYVPYFRGNYSFLNLAKLVKEHESAETIQGSKVFAEIPY